MDRLVCLIAALFGSNISYNFYNTLGIKYDIDYLKLVAEGLSGLGESFVLAYIDEDLTDLDAIIDVLAKYLQATLPELFEPGA